MSHFPCPIFHITFPISHILSLVNLTQNQLVIILEIHIPIDIQFILGDESLSYHSFYFVSFGNTYFTVAIPFLHLEYSILSLRRVLIHHGKKQDRLLSPPFPSLWNLPHFNCTHSTLSIPTRTATKINNVSTEEISVTLAQW